MWYATLHRPDCGAKTALCRGLPYQDPESRTQEHLPIHPLGVTKVVTTTVSCA